MQILGFVILGLFALVFVLLVGWASVPEFGVDLSLRGLGRYALRGLIRVGGAALMVGLITFGIMAALGMFG